MKPDIPPEQLERIQPIVDQLLDQVRKQTLRLTPGADSALVYELEPGDDA